MIAEFMEVPSAVIISAQSTREDYKLRVYSKDGLHSKKKLKYHNDWNWIMEVVDKIEGIIESKIGIHHAISISWSYSPKKTGTFSKGAGGGGGETVKRTPFESIFGKFHQIHSYYGKGYTFNPKLLSETKIEALWVGCSEFIKWYNKTVKGDKAFANYKLPITK